MTTQSKSCKKIVVCGDGNSGKTTFVSKLQSNDFIEEYTPTLGCEVHVVKGQYNMWDCAGVKKYAGLSDGYFIRANYAIIFADATNVESIKNIQLWHRDLQRVLEYNVPIIVCVNKMDLLSKEEKLTLKKRVVFRKYNTKFISTKNDNVEKILEYLTSYEVLKETIFKNPRGIRFIDDIEIVKKLCLDAIELKKYLTIDMHSQL